MKNQQQKPPVPGPWTTRGQAPPGVDPQTWAWMTEPYYTADEDKDDAYWEGINTEADAQLARMRAAGIIPQPTQAPASTPPDDDDPIR